MTSGVGGSDADCSNFQRGSVHANQHKDPKLSQEELVRLVQAALELLLCSCSVYMYLNSQDFLSAFVQDGSYSCCPRAVSSTNGYSLSSSQTMNQFRPGGSTSVCQVAALKSDSLPSALVCQWIQVSCNVHCVRFSCKTQGLSFLTTSPGSPSYLPSRTTMGH